MGKIITSDQAEKEFGSVTEKIEIPSKTVLAWLNTAEEKMMFLLKENNLFVLDENKKIIYSTLGYSDNDEVFHVFSKKEINELLNLGGNERTLFENRSSVFSITNGNFTLEYSFPCPPFCP